MKSVFMVP